MSNWLLFCSPGPGDDGALVSNEVREIVNITLWRRGLRFHWLSLYRWDCNLKRATQYWLLRGKCLRELDNKRVHWAFQLSSWINVHYKIQKLSSRICLLFLLLIVSIYTKISDSLIIIQAKTGSASLVQMLELIKLRGLWAGCSRVQQHCRVWCPGRVGSVFQWPVVH